MEGQESADSDPDSEIKWAGIGEGGETGRGGGDEIGEKEKSSKFVSAAPSTIRVDAARRQGNAHCLQGLEGDESLLCPLGNTSGNLYMINSIVSSDIPSSIYEHGYNLCAIYGRQPLTGNLWQAIQNQNVWLFYLRFIRPCLPNHVTAISSNFNRFFL